jgi:hypothetical protein
MQGTQNTSSQRMSDLNKQEPLHCMLLPTPPDSSVKCSIVQSYWGGSTSAVSTDVEAGTYDALFEHYFQQCSLALLNNGQHVFARRHQDLSRIVGLFKEGLDRQIIFEKLQESLKLSRGEADDEIVNGTIDLAARLFTMMNVGELPHGITGSSEMTWSDGSMQDFLDQYFSQPPVLSSENMKLEKLFNARNLKRVAGIRIKWTSNLAEHLCMVDDDEKVAVFHHAAFLRLHQRRYEACIDSPQSILDEFILTILSVQYSPTGSYERLLTP